MNNDNKGQTAHTTMVTCKEKDNYDYDYDKQCHDRSFIIVVYINI